jgi:hypothetical protein
VVDGAVALCVTGVPSCRCDPGRAK